MLAFIFAVYFAIALGLARSVVRRHLLRAHLRRHGVPARALVTTKTGLATWVRFDLPTGDRVNAKIPVVLTTAVARHEDVVYSPAAPGRVLAANGLKGRHTWLVLRTVVAVVLFTAGVVGVSSIPWGWS